MRGVLLVLAADAGEHVLLLRVHEHVLFRRRLGCAHAGLLRGRAGGDRVARGSAGLRVVGGRAGGGRRCVGLVGGERPLLEGRAVVRRRLLLLRRRHLVGGRGVLTARRHSRVLARLQATGHRRLLLLLLLLLRRLLLLLLLRLLLLAAHSHGVGHIVVPRGHLVGEHARIGAALT